MLKYIFLITFAVYYAKARNLEQQVVSFPEETKAHIYKAVRQCAGSEAKATELMTIVQSGKYREDEEFKSFIYCAYKASGYLHKDGRINIEKSAVLYPDPEVITKVLKRCDEKRGSTPAETNFEFFKCFQETSPYLIAAS